MAARASRAARRAQLSDSALYDDGWFERKTVASWVSSDGVQDMDISHALWSVFVLGCWYDPNLGG